MEFVKWLASQWEWAKSFLNEPNGKGSNKRLMSNLTVATFLFVYVRVVLATSTPTVIIDIPPTWAAIIAAIIGLGIVDKKISNGSGKKDGLKGEQ